MSNIEHHKNLILPFVGSRLYNYSKKDIEHSFELINKERLFRVGFGYSSKNQDKKNMYNIALKEYENMKENILSNNLIEPVLVISYYKTKKENDTLYVADEKNNYYELPLNTINSKSIADFFCDKDNISFIFTSLGEKYHNYIKQLSDNDEYKKYYFYHILGAYITDSFQDILQSHVVSMLDLEINNNATRFSFGYKALPNLEGNRIIYNLLKLENQNIKLSDTFMFEPELSTAAMISFCKYAHYFAT